MSSDRGMKITGICPLGMKDCEYVEDNTVYRCNWFTEMAGVDPQTGEQVDPQSKCAIAWLPIVNVEVARVTRGARDASVSLREQLAPPVKQLSTLLTGIVNLKALK